MTRLPTRLFCALVLAMLLSGFVMHAQVLTGTLTGTVVDPTDATIPNATVTATDTASGRDYKVTTDARGAFTIPNIPNGIYRVVVEASGFNKEVIERIQVFVSQVANVVAKMEVGAIGVEIQVASEQTVVQTESVELKNSITRSQIITCRCLRATRWTWCAPWPESFLRAARRIRSCTGCAATPPT